MDTLGQYLLFGISRGVPDSRLFQVEPGRDPAGGLYTYSHLTMGPFTPTAGTVRMVTGYCRGRHRIDRCHGCLLVDI